MGDCGNLVKIIGNYSWVIDVDKSVVYDILNIIKDFGYTLHSISWMVGSDSFKLIKSFVPGEYDLIFV